MLAHARVAFGNRLRAVAKILCERGRNSVQLSQAPPQSQCSKEEATTGFRGKSYLSIESILNYADIVIELIGGLTPAEHVRRALEQIGGAAATTISRVGLAAAYGPIEFGASVAGGVPVSRSVDPLALRI